MFSINKLQLTKSICLFRSGFPDTGTMVYVIKIQLGTHLYLFLSVAQSMQGTGTTIMFDMSYRRLKNISDSYLKGCSFSKSNF